MNSIKLSKKNYFENVVVINGTYASGKSMISPIVSSLDRVEQTRKFLIIDQILNLYFLKKIKESSAIFLIRHFLDQSFYDQLIGRNINLRADDETSVFKSKNPIELFERVFRKRSPDIIHEHLKKKTIFSFDSHDTFMNFRIWKKINPNFKFINVYRNPFDVVASWYKRGMGRLETIFINEIPMIKLKNKFIPFYYNKNLKKYFNQNEMDKVIFMVLNCMKYEYLNYKKYKNYKNCIFIEFEEFATNTNFFVNKILKFLKTTKGKKTNIILKRENCPRIITKENYNLNVMKIKNLSSKKSFEVLLKFEKQFIKRKKKLI